MADNELFGISEQLNDTISRQAAIKAIKEDKIDLTDPNVVAVFKATGDFEKAETQSMTCDRHIKILKDLPSAEPERKRGKWIDAVLPNDSGGLQVQVCDQCNTFFPLAYTGGGHNFCPNCGADMREEEQDG